MTPKEKGENLIRKYYSFGINKEGQTLSWYECKQCALIAVDEIIWQLEQYGYYKSLMTYWDAVKQEIENL